MKTEEAIAIFGGVRPLAEALGIATPSVYGWKDDVPPLRVYQIKEIIAEREANK